MPKRVARPRARQRIHGLDWLNLQVTLAGGPVADGHGRDLTRGQKAGAADLARLWHTYRSAILAEGTPPATHWAHRVLELGLPAPFEADPRFDGLEDADRIRREQRTHHDALADHARTVYETLGGAS